MRQLATRRILDPQRNLRISREDSRQADLHETWFRAHQRLIGKTPSIEGAERNRRAIRQSSARLADFENSAGICAGDGLLGRRVLEPSNANVAGE